MQIADNGPLSSGLYCGGMCCHLIAAHPVTAVITGYLECVVGMSLMLMALRSSCMPYHRAGGRCMVARGSVCTTNGGIVGTQCVVAIDMHNDNYLFNAPKRIGYPTQCTATSGELPASQGTWCLDGLQAAYRATRQRSLDMSPLRASCHEGNCILMRSHSCRLRTQWRCG